jgi:hypothetical protein
MAPRAIVAYMLMCQCVKLSDILSVSMVSLTKVSEVVGNCSASGLDEAWLVRHY